MNDNKEIIGKALLTIGGAILVGTVITALTEDEPTREVRSSSRKRKTTSKNLGKLNQKDINKPGRYIVEVPDPRQNKISRSEVSNSIERKYPEHYYSLSKASQYKYRQRLVKELTERTK